MDPSEGLTRRHALAGLAIGAGLPALGGCGDDDPGGGEATPSGSGSTPVEPDSSASAPGEQSPSTEAGLASTGDVPVGGGIILTEQKVVLTQPVKGEIKAFDGTCTHQGCLVSAVTSSIECECHGSRYSLTDGSVEQGPATEPLPEKTVTVRNNRIDVS